MSRLIEGTPSRVAREKAISCMELAYLPVRSVQDVTREIGDGSTPGQLAELGDGVPVPGGAQYAESSF
jgi:hypothetical protein